MARLGDIFTVSSGGTPNKKEPSFYESGTIPWVKTGDLKGKYIPEGIECITEAGLNNSSAKLFPKDTVLIAMYGATIGACSILPYEASTNQACAAFLPHNDVLPEYLFYFLSSKKEQFVRDGVGGAQPNISAGYLKNVEFTPKSIDAQKEVVRSLNSVDDLISLRKQQISKTDELVNARFVELFGDPIANEKEWDTKPLLEMGYCKNGMNFHYEDTGVEINCLGVGDFKDYSIISDTSILPTVSLNEMPSADYMLQDDDIVFVRSNGNKALVGRSVAVYPGKVPTTFSGFCIRYRKTDEAVNIPYLLRILKAESVRQKMAGRGANIQNLNQQILGTLIIPVPPIELQNQFAAFVEQTDKSKLAIQQSLDKLETLKKSLMQKYFG